MKDPDKTSSSLATPLKPDEAFTFKPRALDLQLELDRVDLLYQQNIQGVLALSAFATAYLFSAWPTTNHTFLLTWAGGLFISAIMRVIFTLGWRSKRASIQTFAEIRHWLFGVEALLFVSGCAWGIIAWRIPIEDHDTALITCVAVLLMMGGAIVAYSSSYRAMMCVCIPSLLIWSISLFLAHGHAYHVMGGMLLFSFVLSTMAGRNLNRYILSALRLAVENSYLSRDLQDKVNVQAKQLVAEALLRERAEVEADHRAKSFLLANASHEIRTPLAAINGYTDMLLQNPLLADDVRGDLRMIERNGKYLSSLVNDLLDLSKIENGQMYIQKSHISPEQDLRDVVDLMRPLIESRGLKFEVEILTPLPARIETDSTRLREILINLLSNAAKFTDRGFVRMAVSFDGGTELLHIVVKDSGIGISHEAAKALFRPFSRGETERVQKVQGSGLGLALSRNLARLLGGDVRLITCREGEGCEFEMTVATGVISHEDLRVVSIVGTSQLEAANPFSADHRLNGRSILVVDDSKDLQVLMRRFLERQGATVDVRENGLQAVESARDRRYDLILMDIKMPVMDGYAATQAMREAGYRQPIVAVTAHASTDDRQRCYQSGFDSYVSKPVDFRHLVDDLSRFLV